MTYKPGEKDWMAYLYGEMDDSEKRKFDQYLLEHPEEQAALDNLQNLRNILSAVEEKEVIAPPIVIGDEYPGVRRPAQRYLWHTSWFKAVASVAASLILVLLAGRLTGTQVVVSDNELRLSFGAPAPKNAEEPAPTADAMTAADVQRMINASLEKNNGEIRETLQDNQEKLDASIRNSLAVNSGKLDRLVREASTASQEQIRLYVEGIRAENMQQVKDYFQMTSTEQKNYIENLLVDFSKYLQQQRNDDLRLVQTRMNSLEQNTDLFRHETEQILSSIITTVGVPVSGETKN